jgi:hypothetical protein
MHDIRSSSAARADPPTPADEAFRSVAPVGMPTYDCSPLHGQPADDASPTQYPQDFDELDDDGLDVAATPTGTPPCPAAVAQSLDAHHRIPHVTRYESGHAPSSRPGRPGRPSGFPQVTALRVKPKSHGWILRECERTTGFSAAWTTVPFGSIPTFRWSVHRLQLRRQSDRNGTEPRLSASVSGSLPHPLSPALVFSRRPSLSPRGSELFPTDLSRSGSARTGLGQVRRCG